MDSYARPFPFSMRLLVVQAAFVRLSHASTIRASSEVGLAATTEARGTTKSRAALKEKLLRDAGTSHLLREHAACERHFDRCWAATTATWSREATCRGTHATSCRDVLCDTWLEANCMQGGAAKCTSINHMCQTQAKVSLLQHNVDQRSATESSRHRRVRHKDSTETEASTGVKTDGNVTEEVKELVFLHIPKNAGTSIENAGLKKRVRWGRHRMFYFGMMPMPDRFYCATHHIPPGRLPGVIQDVYKSAEVFCVTRHPYDRAISEYKYLLSVPWGQNKPGVLDREPCTPDGLNYFLQTSLQMVLEGKRFVNDCHMLPQNEFIWDSHRQWCTDIMRFDRMPKVFNELMGKRHYKVKLDHTENQSRGTCPDLSEEDLTNKTMAMLDQVYADDFSLLNYTTGPGAVARVPLATQP